MLALEEVQKENKQRTPCVMEKLPTTKYPTMNATTDTDHIGPSAWKHKKECFTLRGKASLSLNKK